MVKQRKSALPTLKAKTRPPAESSNRFGITPISGEGEWIDLAGSLASYPNSTLSRLIERIKSL